MAKYTANDPDIKKLNESQKQDYNSYLLNYDVDAYQQANQGIDILKNPKKSKYNTVQGVINLLFLVPIVVAVIMLILYLIGGGFYIYSGRVAINPKISFFIAACGLFVVFITVLLVVIYVLYNTISSRLSDIKKVL